MDDAEITNYPLNLGRLGNAGAWYYNFNGTIDEVMVFNRSLSTEEIVAIYVNKTNEIVSNETAINDEWSCGVTPNDGFEDGITLSSNSVTVRLPGIDIYNTSLLLTNSSHYSAFRFFMKNIASYSNLFNWSFYTGESNIGSTLETNLTADENIFVFVEHNYPASGSYIVTTNGTTANEWDKEEVDVTIG